MNESGAYEAETPGGSPATQESSNNLNRSLADIDAAGPKLPECRSNAMEAAYALAHARIYLIFNTDFGIDASDLSKVGRDLDVLRAHQFDRTHPQDFARLRSELDADRSKLRGE